MQVTAGYNNISRVVKILLQNGADVYTQGTRKKASLNDKSKKPHHVAADLNYDVRDVLLIRHSAKVTL